MPATPAGHAPPPDYIGRERDLETLATLLRRAGSGHGSLVLLSGEPGIGKTRTCEELAHRAHATGITTIWGRCWEVGGAPAYWPWTQILQTLLASVARELATQWLAGHTPTIAPLLPDNPLGTLAEDSATPDSPSGRFGIFRSVATVLERAAGTRPLLLLLDDIHGADEPSLLMLEFIARRLADQPIMVVGAYRDVALATGSPLTARLPDLLRQPAARSMTVQPLNAVEIEALAVRVTGHPLSASIGQRLQQLTDGNPLFVLECLRAFQVEDRITDLAEGRIPLPVGLRSAISRHLAPLSADCRSILRAAAVLGREFAIVTLRRLIHYPDDVLLTALLDEAVTLDLLTPDANAGGRYRYAHGLVREALYSELSGVEQLRYHHDAATLLSSMPSREHDAAQIAHHFVEAARRGAESEPAVRAARVAGDRALRLLAYEEAVRLYAVALEVIESFGPDDCQLHTELLLAHGRACNQLGELERGKHSFESARELAKALGSRQLLAHAVLGYGGPLSFPEGGFKDEHHVAMLEEALESWEGIPDPLHARLLSRLAIALYFTDAVEQRHQLCARAQRMARESSDPDAIAHVLLASHAALWGPNAQERLALADELLRLASRRGDRPLAFSAHQWRYCDLLELGDVSAMNHQFQACRALAAELREPAMLGWIDIYETGRATWEGRFEEAEQRLNENINLARWLGNAAATVYFLQLFHLRVLQGRFAELIEPLRATAGLNPAIPAFAIGLAYAHVEIGQLEEARLAASTVVDRVESYPPDINYISTLTCLGLVCARLGQVAHTRRIYGLLERYRGLSVMVGNAFGYCGSVAHWLGIMAAAGGDLEVAIEHFEAAMTAEKAMGSPPWLAMTQYECAAALTARDRRGDLERARGLAAAARQTAERLGMAVLLEQVQALELPEAPPSAALGKPRGTSGNRAVYRREGDFWTLQYGGQTRRLRDSRGLRYIANLLRYPHHEFLVLDLAADGIVNPPPSRVRERHGANIGGRDPVADRQAIGEYKQRLNEIRSDLAEAEANNDVGRAAGLRQEQEVLVGQLTSAVGLGNRQRSMPSDLERARSAVTKRIRDALKKIVEEHPGLGQHLTATVQTGYFCSYTPTGSDEIEWIF